MLIAIRGGWAGISGAQRLARGARKRWLESPDLGSQRNFVFL